MQKQKTNNKLVLMVVFSSIQYDARVIRSAKAINDLGKEIVVISRNSDISYKNKHFKSIVFKSKLKGVFLLISFWFYVLKFSVKHKNDIDLLYMHDYYLSYLGLILSKILKVRWVYDAHELLIRRKDHKHSFRSGFFFFLEKCSIRKADLVIAANEERRRIIQFVYKLKNTVSVANISDRRESKDQSINKEDIIVYQGNMNENRNVSYFIEILKYLPERIKLKLVGGGPDIPMYKQLVEDLNLSHRVIFAGWIPYSQLLNESKQCKLAIVYYSLIGLNNYYCSPNKVYEYAQIGIPMFVSPQPFLKYIVIKYKIGQVLDINNTIESEAKKMLNIIDNYAQYQKGMKSFLSDYTYEKEMMKLKKAVSEII